MTVRSTLFLAKQWRYLGMISIERTPTSDYLFASLLLLIVFLLDVLLEVSFSVERCATNVAFIIVCHTLSTTPSIPINPRLPSKSGFPVRDTYKETQRGARNIDQENGTA